MISFLLSVFSPRSCAGCCVCVCVYGPCVCVCVPVFICDTVVYSEASPAPVGQAYLQKNDGSPLRGSAKAGRGHSKVVTFGGVTEIEQPIDTVVSSEGEETELLRRLLSKENVAIPTIGLVSQLCERERRYGWGQIGYSGLNPKSAASYGLCWGNEQIPFCFIACYAV